MCQFDSGLSVKLMVLNLFICRALCGFIFRGGIRTNLSIVLALPIYTKNADDKEKNCKWKINIIDEGERKRHAKNIRIISFSYSS